MTTMEIGLEPFRPPLAWRQQPTSCADLARLPLRSLLYFVLSAKKEDTEKPRG